MSCDPSSNGRAPKPERRQITAIPLTNGIVLDTEGVDPKYRARVETVFLSLAHHIPRWVRELTITSDDNSSNGHLASCGYRNAEDGLARITLLANLLTKTTAEQYDVILHELGHLHQVNWYAAFAEAIEAIRSTGEDRLADVIERRRDRAAEQCANDYARAAGMDLCRAGVITPPEIRLGEELARGKSS